MKLSEQPVPAELGIRVGNCFAIHLLNDYGGRLFQLKPVPIKLLDKPSCPGLTVPDSPLVKVPDFVINARIVCTINGNVSSKWYFKYTDTHGDSLVVDPNNGYI